MLAIERLLDLADMLGWLAALQVEREDFAAARAARREVLDILRKGAANPIGVSPMPARRSKTSSA